MKEQGKEKVTKYIVINSVVPVLFFSKQLLVHGICEQTLDWY